MLDFLDFPSIHVRESAFRNPQSLKRHAQACMRAELSQRDPDFRIYQSNFLVDDLGGYRAMDRESNLQQCSEKKKKQFKKKPNKKHAHTQNGCTKCVLDSDHAKKYLVVCH